MFSTIGQFSLYVAISVIQRCGTIACKTNFRSPSGYEFVAKGAHMSARMCACVCSKTCMSAQEFFFAAHNCIFVAFDLFCTYKKHRENRKTLPREHHIGCQVCRIALSKSTKKVKNIASVVNV